MAQHRGRAPKGASPERDVGDGGRAHRSPRARPAHRSGDWTAPRDRLRGVVAPVVAAGGYDLEDLSLSRIGRRHLVRIVVDADGGVSLDAIADLSRDISAALDAAEEAGGELVAGEYQLEVGSPGVDRPLTEPRHWRRNIGRLVRVKVADRQLTGRILGADEAGVRIEVDGVTAELSHPVLGPGHVQVEFGRVEDLPDPADDDLAEDGSAEDDLDEIEEEGEDEE